MIDWIIDIGGVIFFASLVLCMVAIAFMAGSDLYYDWRQEKVREENTEATKKRFENLMEEFWDERDTDK